MNSDQDREFDLFKECSGGRAFIISAPRTSLVQRFSAYTEFIVRSSFALRTVPHFNCDR